ncbi:hypothetical protein CC78DRAFT_582452 [Lojkania enalia]|uniref:Uncharacterized protein n=1 Tax=Lojkania enalia TaxID=147567 RepID=A0A9P4K3Z3_9PLEO|nr:hypothetical protein CC78DRAFT_582452 [Didymosphaeria enalia]
MATSKAAGGAGPAKGRNTGHHLTGNHVKHIGVISSRFTNPSGLSYHTFVQPHDNSIAFHPTRSNHQSLRTGKMQFSLVAVVAALAATSTASFVPRAGNVTMVYPTATGTGVPTGPASTSPPPFTGAAMPMATQAGSLVGMVVAAGGVALHTYVPTYVVLPHTWTEGQYVTYNELVAGARKNKPGYDKIRFCSTSDELSTAINSIFRYYQRANKYYAYLSNVKIPDEVIGA